MPRKYLQLYSQNIDLFDLGILKGIKVDFHFTYTFSIRINYKQWANNVSRINIVYLILISLTNSIMVLAGDYSILVW